tara:strand:+ start:52 stop:240 length:189 start_codon:yes stop_codon:yes gene_type:complete
MKYKEKIENHLDSIERSHASVERMLSEYSVTGNQRAIREAIQRNKEATRFTEHLRNLIELEK